MADQFQPPAGTPGARKRDAAATPLRQRFAAAMNVLTGRAFDAGWFGPGQPRPPQAPDDEAGRRFDFPVGYNTRQQPRDGEPTTYETLRALADNYDVLRLVIETRKDQMCAQRWTVGPVEKNAKPDSRCEDLVKFLRRPDRENTWQTWLRALLEDLWVIDAPTIYPRPTMGGDLFALELVDGATIKRILDHTGRTPMPPEPAYQQVLKGLPATDYTRDELIYRPRNVRTHKVYGFSPVEQIIVTVNIALRRSAYTLEYYQSGSLPEALASVPKEWNPDQIARFQLYWDTLISGDLAERRKMRFIPDGMRYQEVRQPPLKDLFDEWLARVTCFAFSIEPTPFVAQVNRAVAQTSREQSLAEGLAPTKEWVKDLLDDVIQLRMGFDDLEFAWVDEEALDPLVRAQVDKIYLDAGVLHPDEVRQDLGREPLTDEQKADLAPPPPVAPPGQEQDGAGGDQQQQPDDAGQGGPATPGKLGKARRWPTLAAADRAAGAAKRKLAAFFEAQAGRVADQLVATLGLGKADDRGERRAHDAVAGLDLGDWQQVPAIVEPALLLGARRGLGVAELQLHVEWDEDALDLVNEQAVAWARARSAEMVGMRWVDDELVENPDARWVITDSVREFLRADVETAIEEGWSVDTLRSAIEENYAFSRERAETIARTESLRASNEGNLIGYRAAGVQAKEFNAAHDCCDECQELDGTQVPIDAEFEPGCASPPLHPNCRCALLPVLPDDEGDNPDPES